MAIAFYSKCTKGMSALQLSCDLNVQYKTAFVLAYKMGESLMDGQTAKLDDEIDSASVNGHVRSANRIQNRIDRRLKADEDLDKRAVLVSNERHQNEIKVGTKRLRILLRQRQKRQ